MLRMKPVNNRRELKRRAVTGKYFIPWVFRAFSGLVLFCASLHLQAVVVCGDAYECQGLVGTDTEYGCLGESSCRDANLTATNFEVGCFGKNACRDATLTSTISYVQCDGESACSRATINASSYTYCRADYGCYDANITTDANLYCSGYYSCANADVTSDELSGSSAAYCEGMYGCYNSIFNVNPNGDQYSLECEGAFGCFRSILNVVSGTTTSLDCRNAHYGCRELSVVGDLVDTTFNLYCAGDVDVGGSVDTEACLNMVINIDDGRGMNFSADSGLGDYTVYAEKINNATVVTGTTTGQFTFGYYDYDGDGMPDTQFSCGATMADCTLLGYTIDSDDDNDGVNDAVDACHDDSGIGGTTVGGQLGTGSGHINGDLDGNGCDDVTEDGGA